MERNFKNSKLSFKMVSEGNEDGRPTCPTKRTSTAG